MPKKSTIAQLPPDILATLQELLRDPRVSQLEVTAQINELLAAAGSEDRVSKSSVNRYAVKMEEVGAKLRQSRDIAEMWIGKLGAAPQGQVGHLVNEIVRTLAFDCAMTLAEGEEPVPPKMLKDLAIAVERLERAATQNVKREDEIRKQALSDATEQACEVAKNNGLSEDAIKQIRAKVMGIHG